MGRTRMAAAAATSLALLPLLLEARLARATRPLDDSWKELPITNRAGTLLGLSFRPRQVEAFGLDGRATLSTLLGYPFELIRLGAYWNRIEAKPGGFDTGELDWQLDAAERAGKQVIVGAGPVKNFGYPEFYVPQHRLERPLREGSLVGGASHARLLGAATQYLTRLVERYRDRRAIVAWQLEHEAVDPLGVEHSWRLGVDFVRAEVEALRAADPSRPVMLNGFLPTSFPVRLTQWWRTRDQGDSLAVAARLADIVGIDYYPRHALAELGPATLYLDGATLPWQRLLSEALLESVRRQGKRLMVAEGQAEPWETVTTPPNPPPAMAMSSCPPRRLIENYNAAMSWSRPDRPLYAYLFWGAEYWLLRAEAGDRTYLDAFARVLDSA